MKIKRLYLLLGVLVSSANLRAQITLSDYRSQVLNYSLDLKKGEVSAMSSYDELAKIKTLRLPTLSLSGSFDYNMRSVNGQKPWGFAVQPQFTQTLYGGGSVRAQVETYELKYDVALCDLEFTYLEVVYSADYAYWNLISMGRYRDAMREYTGIIKSLKSIIDKRFEEGYISKSDVLMMATRLNEAEYNLVSVELSYTVALHNFNILRGEHADEPVDLISIEAERVLLPRRVELLEVLKRRPDYMATQLSVDIYDAAIRSVKATYNPTLSVGVGASWSQYMPNYNGSTRIDGSAFLQMSATLFHFGERRKAVSVAKAACLSSEITEAILYDSIELEETNGWASVVDTHAQVRAASESLAIASENLEISTYSYNEGQATILDVMQAQISWIQTYTNAIDAGFNYMVAISLYDKIAANVNSGNIN